MLLRMIVAIICMLFIHRCAFSASFDCGGASGPLEKTICADDQLSRADEEMAKYYFKLHESLERDKANELLKEQKSWLKLRTSKCTAEDSACLKKLYNEHIHALRTKYERLVPFIFPDSNSRQGERNTCGFPDLKLPEIYSVYATGSYSGRKIDYQIDQSGHQATQFDIAVNSPEKPVVLILGAYEPSVWNIGVTKGTNILAVIASGYHRQAVAGLPIEIPILISTYDNKGPCKYLYIAENKIAELNPLSKMVFGKAVDMVYIAKNGKAVLGEPIKPDEQLFTSSDTRPESYFDKSKPLAGPAGINDAVRKGLIRPSTPNDLEAWANKMATRLPKDSLPPVSGGDSRAALKPRYVHNGYVILKAFSLPAGLYGAHSATFFLPEGVPYPEGDLGHSTLYDFNTMTCRGAACRAE